MFKKTPLIFEKDKNSNIAYLCCILSFFLLVMTDFNTEETMWEVLFMALLATHFCSFYDNFRSTVMRLFVTILPFLFMLTTQTLKVEINVIDTTYILLGLSFISFPVYCLYTFRVFQKKYGNSLATIFEWDKKREYDKKEVNLKREEKPNNYDTKTSREPPIYLKRVHDFYLQDLQDELERRSLTKEILFMSTLGGIETSSYIDQASVDSKEIYQKIRSFLAKQEQEKKEIQLAKEKKEMREVYHQYKENVFESYK